MFSCADSVSSPTYPLSLISALLFFFSPLLYSSPLLLSNPLSSARSILFSFPSLPLSSSSIPLLFSSPVCRHVRAFSAVRSSIRKTGRPSPAQVKQYFNFMLKLMLMLELKLKLEVKLGAGVSMNFNFHFNDNFIPFADWIIREERSQTAVLTR